MAETTSIGSTLGFLQNALELGKTLIKLRDAVAIQTKAAELLGQITAAHEMAMRSQTREAALLEQIRDLEEYKRETEAWENTERRYKLSSLPPGVMVYEIKEDARGDEPPHYVCANCFQQRRKSFLNSDEPAHGRTKIHCPACGFEDRIGQFKPPNIVRGGTWGR